MDKKQITINQERRLYILNNGGGYYCYGFDNCYRDAVALAKRMTEHEAGKKDAVQYQAPSPSLVGTIECYERYKALLAQWATHPASKKTWFEPGTPKKVMDILERAIRQRSDEPVDDPQLRLFYGDAETGRDWCEECDTVGFIGRGTGSMKVPLLIEPLLDAYGCIRSADGGGAINTRNILRIIDITSGKEMFRAANYQLPDLDIQIDDTQKTHRFSVKRDGKETLAAFKTREEAEQHIAFLKGYRVRNTPRTWNEYCQDSELMAA